MLFFTAEIAESAEEQNGSSLLIDFRHEIIQIIDRLLALEPLHCYRLNSLRIIKFFSKSLFSLRSLRPLR
jgi:hypothetical protein